MFHSYTPAS